MSDKRCQVDADTGEPSVEQTMRALADDRRRAALAHLIDRDSSGPVSVDGLATHVAEAAGRSSDDGQATDRNADADSPNAYERAYASLHHADLPFLDDAGIVTYRPNDETVRLAGDRPLVEDLLGIVHDDFVAALDG